jgi:hypothetical protein
VSAQPKERKPRSDKPSVTLPGTVEKIIPPVPPLEPEKAQIAVEGADDLYKEIRVENALEDVNGESVKLKPGADVEVTIEADKQAVAPKKPAKHTKDREPVPGES